MSFQTLISSLEIGVGMRIIRGFLVLCTVTACFGLFAWSQFRGLKDPEAMELAQLARNMADGKGFTTQCIRPADLWFVARGSGQACDLQTFPDIRHAPAYPWLLSRAMRWFTSSTEVNPDGRPFAPEYKLILPCGMLLVAGTAWLVFLLGSRLFDAGVGAVAAVLFLVTERVLRIAIGGTALPLVMFLGTASVCALAVAVLNWADGRASWRWALPFVAGSLLCGLGVLAGYKAAVFIPVLALFLGGSLDRGRWLAVAAVMAVCLLVVSPWMMRNVAVCGRGFGAAPYTALNDSSLYAKNGFDRAAVPEIRGAPTLPPLRAKLVARLRPVIERGLPGLGGGLLVTAFFVVSLFGSRDRDEINRLRWAVAAGIVWLAVVAALWGHSAGDLPDLLLPLVVVFATASFFAILEGVGLTATAWQPFLTWILVMATALPAILAVASLRPAFPYPPYFPPFAAYAADRMEANEALCTDIPWATAWYGNRASVLLPSSVEEFDRLCTVYPAIRALYLTTETTDQPYVSGLLESDGGSWAPVVNRLLPKEFPFRQGFELPPGSHEQLFLTDRVRWPSPAASTSD